MTARMRTSGLRLALLASLAALPSCTRWLGDTTPPPVYSSMPSQQLKTALSKRITAGMSRDSALHAINSFRMQPQPAGLQGIRRDSDGLTAPYPVHGTRATPTAPPGWTRVSPPAADTVETFHAIAHFEIWYVVSRPPGADFVSADFTRRSMSVYFGSDGTLRSIEVGPAIGFSGDLCEDGFTISAPTFEVQSP